MVPVRLLLPKSLTRLHANDTSTTNTILLLRPLLAPRQWSRAVKFVSVYAAHIACHGDVLLLSPSISLLIRWPFVAWRCTYKVCKALRSVLLGMVPLRRLLWRSLIL